MSVLYLSLFIVFYWLLKAFNWSLIFKAFNWLINVFYCLFKRFNSKRYTDIIPDLKVINILSVINFVYSEVIIIFISQSKLFNFINYLTIH